MMMMICLCDDDDDYDYDFLYVESVVLRKNIVDIWEFYLPLVKIKILIRNKKVGKAPRKLWNIFEVWKLFDVKEVPTRQ